MKLRCLMMLIWKSSLERFKSLFFPLYNHSNLSLIIIKGPEIQQAKEKWARPAPPILDQARDTLTFQQVDIDYYTDKPMKGMPGAQSGTVATMRIFGVTRQQNSICCHVHGFAPYLYVTVPPQFEVKSNRIVYFLHQCIFLFSHLKICT